MKQDPARARAEIVKHLAGDLTLAPLPSEPGRRLAEITGAVKHDGLLGAQEAVRLHVVAGAGFEPATFGL